ncbi:MAG: hypothetical protein V3W44_09620 [Dehalococcoidales bacterium]
MATQISSPKAYSGIDVDALCRSWRTATDGTEYAMSNHFDAIAMLAQGLNHCAGQQLRRPQFQVNWHPTVADTTGSDPLLRWLFNDDVHDGRDVIYRILALMRVSGSGDSYAGREAAPTVDRTPHWNQTATGSGRADPFPEELRELEFTYARGARTATELTEGLSTFQGFTPIDVVVYDKAVSTLVDGTHTNFADVQGKFGDPVLANYVEKIRSAFHTIRTTNLPILSHWSAHAAGGSFAATSAAPSSSPFATGNEDGMKVRGGYINILDFGAGDVRTATSAGIPCHIKNMGIGSDTLSSGNQVRVQCRIYAQRVAVTGSHDVGAKFIGPVGETNITVDGGLAWYGDSTNFVDLSPNLDDDEAGAPRNKIDILVKGRNNAEPLEVSDCHVFGWVMWVEYNNYFG